MILKKKYLGLLLLPLLLAMCQSEFLSFRKSDSAQRTFFEKHGKLEVNFKGLQIQDQGIHYTHTGQDSLPLVLFVHGSPGSSSAFLDYMVSPHLDTAVQMIAVDRPGYGYSDFGRAEPSLEKQAELLKTILKKHNFSKTILVGHSYGGPVIARMAMDFPDLIGGLVLVAGSIDPALEPREWWRKPLNLPVIRWMLPPSFRVCNQEILPLKAELEKMMPYWDRIVCPVTIIQGTADKLVAAENADFALSVLTNCPGLNMQKLEGKGHFILWEMREFIQEQILQMVRENP